MMLAGPVLAKIGPLCESEGPLLSVDLAPGQSTHLDEWLGFQPPSPPSLPVLLGCTVCTNVHVALDVNFPFFFSHCVNLEEKKKNFT
jgi:hypothetical protein